MFSMRLLALCLILNFAVSLKHEPERSSSGSELLQVIRGRRIDNGRKAEIGEFPYHVALLLWIVPFCAGSILNEKWILTAKHCVSQKEARFVYVKAGGILMETNDQATIKQVQRFVFHDDGSDIALMELSDMLDIMGSGGRIGVISLSMKKDLNGLFATATGWGSLWEACPTSNQLMVSTVPLFGKHQCEQAYPDQYDHDSMFCTGYDWREDSPGHGDSGGPLVISEGGQKRLLGVISVVDSCGPRHKPVICIRVSKYAEWIQQYVN